MKLNERGAELASLLYVVLCAGFIWLLAAEGVSRVVLWSAIALLLLIAALGGWYRYAIRRTMRDVTESLSLTIQSLIDGRQRQLFPIAEDSMLSKLQDQTLKLARIMRAQEERYKTESENVKALVTDIAHQLKTPLANLHMYNSLLQDDELPDAQRREFLQALGSSIDRLSWLMDGLIRMSRLESGVIAVRKERKAINDSVLTAIKACYPMVEQRGIELIWHESESFMLPHDASWTSEAIANVIDNAVKYSPPASVVRLTVERSELFARIVVSDEGRGIPLQEHGSIFKRFYRGVEASGMEGSGIGLYVAREIIANQGGYMELSSRPGEGSTFTIFLPIEE